MENSQNELWTIQEHWDWCCSCPYAGSQKSVPAACLCVYFLACHGQVSIINKIHKHLRHEFMVPSVGGFAAPSMSHHPNDPLRAGRLGVPGLAASVPGTPS